MDISLTRAYAGRPAVGIIRVEREIAKYLSRSPDVVFVFHDADNQCFRIVDASTVTRIFSSDQQPQQPLAEQTANHSRLLPKGLPYGPKFEFHPADIYINCGLPWDSEILADLYAERVTVKFFIVQIVYDIIPALMPELCVPGMLTRFPKFLIDISWCADIVYSISESTRSDLENFFVLHNLRVPRLDRIYLGSDLIGGPVSLQARSVELPDDTRLDENSKYVIYVSSIEPRKNHLFLFNVWQSLFRRLGSDLPKLVFVGSQGWNNADLIFYVENSALFRARKIEFRRHLNDEELRALYQGCIFTVYPSLYEGWGLPIAESLGYGKLCIASNTSSMPEAGQGLIELIDPRDFALWCDKCLYYITDPSALVEKEHNIALNRKQLSWRECAEGFIMDLQQVVGSAPVKALL